MKIAQLVPGTCNIFYCENCLRDYDLNEAWRALGHDADLVPLYLPLLADGQAAVTQTPMFFGGINVYLQQKSAFFRKTPRWLDRLFDSRRLLEWVSRKAGMTSAHDLGETTLSMLRGEAGRQAKEVRRLVEYLAGRHRPDVVCLSNVLLAALARPIGEAVGVPVVCLLQDENAFLDALPEAQRAGVGPASRLRGRGRCVRCRQFLLSRCDDPSAGPPSCARRRGPLRDQSGRIPPRGSAAGPAGDRLPGRGGTEQGPGFARRGVRGPEKSPRPAEPETSRRGRPPGGERGGASGRASASGVAIPRGRRRVPAEPRPGEAQDFLRTLSVLSVPTKRPEAYGMYVLEALASGVPVVAPRHGGVVELVEETGGGLLVEPNDPAALAEALAALLLDPEKARAMAERGRRAVAEKFDARRTARDVVAVFEQTIARV